MKKEVYPATNCTALTEPNSTFTADGSFAPETNSKKRELELFSSVATPPWVQHTQAEERWLQQQEQKMREKNTLERTQHQDRESEHGGQGFQGLEEQSKLLHEVLLFSC
jgi:hypothetical protein